MTSVDKSDEKNESTSCQENNGSPSQTDTQDKAQTFVNHVD